MNLKQFMHRKALKKLLSATALATLFALPLTSSAEDTCDPCCCGLFNRFYAAGTGAIGWHNDSQFVSSDGDVTYSYKTGYGFSIALGATHFCNLRTEVELSYRTNDLDNRTSYATGLQSDAKGETSYTNVMLNAFYDFPVWDCFSIYLGAGVGMSFYEFNLKSFAGNDINSKNTANVWAWQFMPGVAYHFSECWAVTAGYRFFGTEKIRAKDGTATNRASNIQGAELGLRFYF